MMQTETEKSRLLQSNIVSGDENLQFRNGGKTIHIPFWKNLDGDDEVLQDGIAMTVSKIDSDESIATIHLRGKTWGASDLASLLSGDSAMDAIAEKAGEYWARQKQKVLISTLTGISANATFANKHVLDISASEGDAGVISAKAMIDTESLMGDNFDQLSGVMMHSRVMQKLRQLDLIDLVPDSQSNSQIQTYMGRPVIVDDMLTPTGNAYPVYFFGAGAIAYNELDGLPKVETDRQKKAGLDELITRQQFTMHPRGFSFVGEIAGITASNAELATGTNWKLVDDVKNINIVKLVARIA